MEAIIAVRKTAPSLAIVAMASNKLMKNAMMQKRVQAVQAVAIW